MVIFHGASCDTEYEQAEAPDVLNETALGKGFVTMSHALDNAGHNCNIATQAESLIMTKERVIDRYGTIRYTIGSGCSGGSLVQQQVANAYPGLYQGLTPACSFTDAWSSAMQYVNYQLLRRYYENPSKWAPGVAWTPDAIAAVEGHPNPANAVTFTEVIPSSGEPSRSCPGVPPEKVYDEKTNPKGVRCTFRSEEHTSELQSRQYLVCRLLLEKKKKKPSSTPTSVMPIWPVYRKRTYASASLHAVTAPARPASALVFRQALRAQTTASSARNTR